MDISSLFQSTLIPEMKTETKKPEKKPDAKKGTKKGSKPVRYRLPVTLYSNYTEPVVIEGNGFPEEMTEAEILKETRERHSCFKNFTTEVLDEKTMLLIPQAYNCVKKGSLKITDELEVRFGDEIMDISPVAGDLTEIAYEKLIRYASGQAGTGIDLLHENNLVTLLYSMDGSGSIGNLKFPVTAVLGANTSIAIQEDDFREFVGSMNTKKKSVPEGTTDDGISGDENKTDTGEMPSGETLQEDILPIQELLTANNFLRYIESKEPTYKGGHGQLYVNEKLNFVRVLYKKKFAAVNRTEKKAALYPADAILSLIYEKIQLAPEMFGGRKEVTERDIQKYLEKDRPEYSKERTKIEYDEKNRLIIATIMGGKRGSVKYSDENGMRYRISDTPFMQIRAATDGSGQGQMTWKIPKIPYHMLCSMCSFFKKVFCAHGTESLVSILWDPDKNAYFLYVPRQWVTPSSVDYQNDGDIQKHMWTVGTFHSHGRFSPYFSDTDDEYEKADGIYGVAGNFDCPAPCMKMRAGTGGHYITIHTGDVFDMDSGGEAEDLWTAENISSIHAGMDD